jgi:hypothetical protein
MGALIKMLPVLAVMLFFTGSTAKMAKPFHDLIERVQVKGGSWTPDPARKTEACRRQRHGRLADPGCTPGAIDTSIDRSRLCGPTPRRLHGSAPLAHSVRRGYSGVSGPVEFLISPMIGGSATRANMWPIRPQDVGRYRRAERRLRGRVCAGQVTLREAQYAMSKNWRTAAP